jgi:hypothetical protein
MKWAHVANVGEISKWQWNGENIENGGEMAAAKAMASINGVMWAWRLAKYKRIIGESVIMKMSSA